MATGTRSAIFGDIDDLSNCEGFADAIPKIQAILSKLAYYAIESDSAINETHEEWHGTFADRLREGVSSTPQKKTRPEPIPSSKSEFRGAGTPQKSKPAKYRNDSDDDELPGAAPRRTPAPRAPTSTRTKPTSSKSAPRTADAGDSAAVEDVPASLLAIMQGRHASLHQEDDEMVRGYTERSRSAGGKSKGTRFGAD